MGPELVFVEGRILQVVQAKSCGGESSTEGKPLKTLNPKL
jgi:hypothetical protein